MKTQHRECDEHMIKTMYLVVLLVFAVAARDSELDKVRREAVFLFSFLLTLPNHSVSSRSGATGPRVR